MIPQAHVVERLPVRVDVGAREFGIARELTLLDGVERERAARGVDVVLDERRFAHLFVGRHDEALNRAGVNLSGQGHDRVEANRRNRGGRAFGEGVGHGADRAQERGGHFGQRKRQPRVHVGVAGAADDAIDREQRVRPVEPGADREQHQERGREQAQVASRAGPQTHAERRDGELSAEQIQGAGTGGGDAHLRHGERARQVEHRQREDVERHVETQDGIGRAERLGLLPADDVLPARGGKERAEHGGAGGHDRPKRLYLPSRGQGHGHAFGRGDDLRFRRQGAHGHPQIEGEPGQ